MPQGPIRKIVEAAINDAAGDVRKGQTKATEKLMRMVEAGASSDTQNQGLTPDQIRSMSIQDLFESFCNWDGNLDMDDAVAVREAVVSSAFPTITSKLISSLLIPAYNYALGDAMNLVTKVTSKTPDETIVGFGAMDQLERIGETVAYPETNFAEKYVVIRNFKFGRMIAVTREAIHFDLTNRVLGRAGSVGEKAGLHQHKLIIQKATGVAATYTGEAATANFKYNGTAAAIFSNDHSAVDNQTNDNIVTTAFSHASLKELRVLAAGIVDEEGERVNFIQKMLLVPAELVTEAEQLLGSDRQYDVASNAINPFKGKWTLMSSPYLDDNSTTLHYLGDFPKQTVWSEVWPLRVERDSGDFSNDTVVRIKVSYMGNAGNTDYRFVMRGGT